MSAPPFPLPDLDWEPTRGFFAAAAAGQLAIPRCDACGDFHWYPPLDLACPGCGAALRWAPVAGRGRLFSWTQVTRALAKELAVLTPYVPALVELEEDARVRLVTLLVDGPPDALVIGQAVEVVFRRLPFPGADPPIVVPMFRTCAGAQPP